MTKEEFNKRSKAVGVAIKNIEMVGDYKGYLEESAFMCKKCKKPFISTPFNIITKKDRCPYCFDNSGIVGNNRRNGGNAQKSKEEFRKEFIKMVGDRLIQKSEYVGSSRYVDVQCKKCGYDFQTKGYHIVKGDVSCPVCSSRIVVPGINSIRDTDPDLVEWFVNSDDTIAYSRSSNVHVNLKCPVCGSLFEGEINRFINRDTYCVNCKSGVSIPNKIIRNLMKECEDQVEYYKYEWKIPEDRLKTKVKYSYDMYFIKDGKEYVVEMDGSFHDMEDQQKVDKIKDSCLNSIMVSLIRIDCRDSDIGYIKNNILKSELSKILRLENIDWDKIGMRCVVNDTKRKVLELYNDGYSPRDIEKMLNGDIGSTNIRRFLIMASKNGKCTFRAYKYKGNWCNGKTRYLYIDENDQYGNCCKAVDEEGNVKYYVTQSMLVEDLNLTSKLYKFNNEKYYHGYKLYTVSNKEMYENNKDMFEEI